VTDPTRVVVRPASGADALDVLAWRNDPVTRAMARNQDEVDTAAHLAWFGKALADPRRTFLIGEVDGEKIGMVRFDRGEETEVSINLDPAHRSRGLSYPLLMAGLAYVGGDVWAEIRPENTASLRLFERAGFEFSEIRGGLRRYLRRSG
jgi:RimJ/RimL family protein N-acetyltransferase